MTRSFQWQRVGPLEWLGHSGGNPAYCARVERLGFNWQAAVWRDWEQDRDDETWSSAGDLINAKSSEDACRLCELVCGLFYARDRLRDEALRWYKADGTFETLATPEEVVERRKAAAAELAKLRERAGSAEARGRQLAERVALARGRLSEATEHDRLDGRFFYEGFHGSLAAELSAALAAHDAAGAEKGGATA